MYYGPKEGNRDREEGQVREIEGYFSMYHYTQKIIFIIFIN